VFDFPLPEAVDVAALQRRRRVSASLAAFPAGITWIGLLYYFNFVQGPSSLSRRRDEERRHAEARAARAVVVPLSALFTFLSAL